jgi:hypothetical protein
MLVALIALLALLGARPEPANTASVVSSLPALQNAVHNASAGKTVYVAGGTYGSVTLNSHRKTWVTVRPAPGASVHLADLNFGSNASHIAVRRLYVDGDVDLAPTGADHIRIFDSDLSGVSAKWGTNHIKIVHNWIHDCSNCIELVSTASNVPGAPDPHATNLPPVRHIEIVGNRIARPHTDAIFITNFRHVRVEGNEITGVIENGNHNDSLQTVWGGDELIFQRNYIHDKPYWTIRATIKRNTVWNVEAPVVLQGRENRAMVVRNNVFNEMLVEDGLQSYYRNRSVLDQYDNVIRGGWNWGATSRDKKVRPHFRGPAHNDFRLKKHQVARLGFRAGVSWAVGRRVFGPR